MAGIYFAFSTFVMQAFANINHLHAISAMNSINKVILRSWFMPLFFGSSIIALLLVIFSIMSWNQQGSEWMFIAGVIYLLGMFFCTAFFNVPLNNALAAIDVNNEKAEVIWLNYLNKWTKWNHLRTVSSALSFVLCLWVLFIYG